MNHTKEPWEEIKKQLAYLQDDWFELDKAYIHFSNLKALLNDSFLERSKVEHLACAGITNEALEAGVVHSALINFEESLGLEKGEKFCFYDIPVLEDV